MNKEEWKNYKKYAINHLWECENNGWRSPLCGFNVQKLIRDISLFIKKQYIKYVKFRFKLTQKPIIPVLEYVATKCTMNCKNCNTLVTYFSNETHIKPVDFETYKKDLDKLLKSVDYISLFGFVGGEPLLNKDLPKMR